MKPSIIKLTAIWGESTKDVYVNIPYIQRYWESTDGGTILVFNDSADITVKESPNAISRVIMALNK
jgi:hypothetical protein